MPDGQEVHVIVPSRDDASVPASQGGTRSQGSQNPRARRWVFTFNNHPPNWRNLLAQLVACQDLKIKYLVCEEEQGAQGTPHLQGYLRADKQIYYNTLRSKLKCYWAVAEGSEEQNIRYCTKENGPKFEAGTPQTQAAKALRDRDQRVLDMQRDVVQLPWDQFEAKYPWEATYRGGIWLKWRFEHMPQQTRYDGDLKDKNVWVWGPPGTGKSRWAFGQSERCYVHCPNKWWDGWHLKDYDTVIIDDWPNDRPMSAQYIKQWADRYQFTAEVKGSSVTICPGSYRLIITSNYPPEECFGAVDAAAVRRRFYVWNLRDPEDIRLHMKVGELQAVPEDN